MAPFTVHNLDSFAVKTFSGRGAKRPIEEPGPAKAREGFLFGADPEFFLVDNKGVIVPGTPDIIPGTKAEPHPVKGGAVQLDGVAAEINIPPAHTFEEWSDSFDTVIDSLKKLLPKGWDLSTKASHIFDKDVFDAIPDECKLLGCSPDFNAWEMTLNTPPEVENPYLRCIGGHLHTGFSGGPYDVTDIQHILACADLSKQFDWFLGYWSLTVDEDTQRRSLYGKAGSCRIKDYGVEYRVLSPFWVLNKNFRLEVWNRMQAAIRHMTNYYMPDRGGSRYNAAIKSGIDSGIVAEKVLNDCEFPVMTINERYGRF